MIHVVTAGETATAIAARYGISVAQLSAQNGLTQPDRLVVGQALLVLRPSRTRSVNAGDTLFSIALSEGLSLRQLYRLNPQLQGAPDIWPGQTLTLGWEQEENWPLLVNGYTYPFIDRQLLRGVLPYLSALQPFTYGFTPGGDLVMIDDAELRIMARDAGTATVLVLAPLTSGGQFDNDLITAVLADEEARENLISNTVQLAEGLDYDGVDLDFEFVRETDSAGYVGLAAELALRLHRIGKPLSVALAPKYYAEQRGLLYEGHDYNELGRVADLAMLMTYEWGYLYGPPLAIAPLYEVRRVVEYGLSEIAADKLLMGIPNYGYDWTLPYQEGRAAALVSNTRAVELAWFYEAEIRYDDQAQAPWFTYTTPEGVNHVVWFEDVRSIRAKLALAHETGLRGVSYWTVNRAFPANWTLLSALVEQTPYPSVD